jgi:hypothetical protein
MGIRISAIKEPAMIVRHNHFPLTLTLASNCTPSELAHWSSQPVAWAIGCIDAVDNLPDWTRMAGSGDLTAQEQEDYARGFAVGQELLPATVTAAAA